MHRFSVRLRSASLAFPTGPSRFENADGAPAPWLTARFRPSRELRAHVLCALRTLKPQDKFNVHLGNCPEFLVFYYCARTGTVMVPTNLASTAEHSHRMATAIASLAVREKRLGPAKTSKWADGDLNPCP